jgi:hypothetical protein
MLRLRQHKKEVCDMKEEDVASLQTKEFGKELGFIHEGLITLRKAGMTHALWAKLTESEELATKFVAYVQRGGYDPTTSQKRAREIMGKNFLGVEEVAECFGIQLTAEELAKVAEVPFTEATLEECKDTHILFLGVNHNKEGKPLTINRFREMFPSTGQSRFYSYEDAWYDKEKFATKETPELRWYLIRKTVTEESRSKNYQEQEKLLKENEERERAVVYVYGIFLMFKARNERLFETDYAWCTDLDSDGYRVFVGDFGSEGLYVHYYWDDYYARHLGLAPARKFEK